MTEISTTGLLGFCVKEYKEILQQSVILDLTALVYKDPHITIKKQ